MHNTSSPVTGVDTPASVSLPPPPASVFLIGIGGIGMSGLAQLLRWQGYRVAGSDRETGGDGRDELYAKLGAQGIRLWPQDGSGIRTERPDCLVFSAAIEKGNPDLAAAAGIPVLHRAQALAAALNRMPARQIAVAGSCGKTSVTAWLAVTLRALGARVCTVCGGYIHQLADPVLPGNFHADADPEWSVYEVDESDGSLVSFSPEFGLVLNIGTDHFDRERLGQLFSQFLGHCATGWVAAADLAGVLDVPAGKTGAWFGAASTPNARLDALTPRTVRCGIDGIRFNVPGLGLFHAHQFGRHSVDNAAAVLAVLRLVQPADTDTAGWPAAIAAFRGVARRFDFAGTTARGIPVYDDYAHNVEKIGAAIRTLQELAPGPILIVFQPHGFGPLGFMREELGKMLRQVLRPADRFAFLPVFYAGGTTSFTPTAAEVADAYAAAGLPVLNWRDRGEAEQVVAAGETGATAVLVLGARDPTLPNWCRKLAGA